MNLRLAVNHCPRRKEEAAAARVTKGRENSQPRSVGLLCLPDCKQVTVSLLRLSSTAHLSRGRSETNFIKTTNLPILSASKTTIIIIIIAAQRERGRVSK